MSQNVKNFQNIIIMVGLETARLSFFIDSIVIS